MCGFVGLINKPNIKVDCRLLKIMADTLSHRGPDDEGGFIDNNIGLYHKRLSIIDLNSGHQPMSFGNYTLVFNGEIYNYLELREELKSKGHKFVTKSDTEVIIRMYDEYGIESINLLNGMFAFLLYDKKEQKIVVARDHFGIKPLYYYNDDNLLIFASEIKAILKHNKINAEPDYESVYEYLTFQYVLNDKTLFKNIFKILPGNFGIYDLKSKTFNQKKYWAPSFKIDNYHNEEYFIHELRSLLENTIDIQLRSDVSVGTYLSGGFDSSIVTMIASKRYNGKLKTFTGAFNEESEQFNETKYSREVATVCNAEIFEIFPTENDFIDLLPKLIYYLDEPVAGPGMFPQYMVSKLASENVKVVLGGQGGDEIFGGYARYVVAYLEQAIKGTIYETNEEGEHIVSLTSILPNLSYLKNYIPMIKEFNKSGMFENMAKRYFRLIDRKNGDEELFSDTFNNNYCKNTIYEKFEKIFNNPDTISYYNKMTNFDMTTNLPALLHVEDRMSMAASIESRVPFLDKRIVDLITSMPAGMKFKGAEMKYILKKSISDILPEAVFYRKDKMGFPVPLHLWSKNGALNFIGDILLSKVSSERGIFNISKVEKLITSERTFGRKLWGILCLELWFKTFIDKN